MILKYKHTPEAPCCADHKSYSPPQKLEGNELPVFVDNPGCVAAVAHRNFYSEVDHFRNFSRSFPLHFPQFFLTQSLCGGEYINHASRNGRSSGSWGHSQY